MIYPFKVSVIVPSYNRAHMLARTLPTYLQEDVGELLLVDDCSKDNTFEVVSSLQKKYPKIQYIKNEKNSGQCFAKNKGILCAKGEYIYFGDDDSVLLEGSIKKLLYAVEKDGFDMAGARALYMGNYCPTDSRSIAIFERWMTNRNRGSCDGIARLAPFQSRFDSYSCRYVEVPYLHACLLCSSENAKNILFDEQYTGCAFREETDFCIRATLAGKKLVYVPDAVQINFPKQVVGNTGARKNGNAAWLESALFCNRRFFEKHWHILSKKYNLTMTENEIICQTENDIRRIAQLKEKADFIKFIKRVYFNIFVRLKYRQASYRKKAVIVSFFGMSNAGGVERVSQYVYEILQNEFDVEILTCANFHLPKLDYFFQALLMSIRLAFIKKDIVIGNSWQAFLYPCDISFSHGTMEGYTRRIGQFRRFSGAGFISFMEKIAALRAKKVIAVSTHVKDELCHLYKIDSKKISVLPNCVDDRLYRYNETQSMREKTLLFSGRLENSKGLQYLKSLSDYLEKINGWRLCIACNQKMNEELFCDNKKTTIYFDLTAADMPKFYNTGDILFFPSLYEGFSMATLEALSCGIPVLGTSFVITKELCQFDFCKDISHIVSNPQKIITEAENMVGKFRNNKKQIHEVIVQKFGKAAYAKSFLYELSTASKEQ